MKSPKTPLILDPQQHCYNFLCQYYEKKQVVVLTPSTNMSAIKADIVKVYMTGGVIILNEIEEKIPQQYQNMVS